MCWNDGYGKMSRNLKKCQTDNRKLEEWGKMIETAHCPTYSKELPDKRRAEEWVEMIQKQD